MESSDPAGMTYSSLDSVNREGCTERQENVQNPFSVNTRTFKMVGTTTKKYSISS